MASTEGKIHLALRNTIDTKEVNPPPVRPRQPVRRSSAPSGRARPRSVTRALLRRPSLRRLT